MKRVAHRLVLALVAACVLVSAASAREATVQDEQLLEVGFFGATKALLMAPEQPKALALLFAGGDGDLRLSGSTGLVVLGPLQANFLIRTRRMWFENDIAILAIDAPGGRPMTALNRLSALGQVETLLAAARKAVAALHAAERAAAEAERIARKAERAAYDAKQARKRAVLKALRDQERSEE